MKIDNKLLRAIPKVDELLKLPEIAPVCEKTPAAAAAAVREVLEEIRERVLSGEIKEIPGIKDIADAVGLRIEKKGEMNLRPVINATGIVLHTNLGRAILSEDAISAVCAVAGGYSTLEYDVEKGTRGSRHSHVDDLITKITGAEAAIVVNNNAAAVLLILSEMTKGKKVIISRGELVEIGGSFRVPEIMEMSGGVLCEVGTTNKTHIRDYQNAIDDDTAALLKVHTSNFKVVGFTEDVPLCDLVKIGKERGIPVIYDLGSGALYDLERMGIQGEPVVKDAVAAGADIISFSGDKLLGGPQAGIIIGKKKYIDLIRKNPLARAVRVDKMTLAALEATLRQYLEPKTAFAKIPTVAMLAISQEGLFEKANALSAAISEKGLPISCTVEKDQGQVGGGSVPTQMLDTYVVSILPEKMTVDAMEMRLRKLSKPVIARIAHDRLILDVRTIDARDFEEIAEDIQAVCSK